MRSSIRSAQMAASMRRSRAVIFAAALGYTPSHAVADDKENKGTFKVESAQVQVGTTDTTLKSTLLFDSDGDQFHGWLAGMTLKIPPNKADGDAETRLDDFTSDWRVGASLGKEWAFLRDKMRAQFEPEWGFKQFRYYPGLATSATSAFRHSFALAANWLYYHEPQARAPMAFQVKARLANDWSDAKSIGIVTPASGTMPALVEDSRIIDSPVEQSSITARVFYWQELGMGSAWALGPSAAIVFAGPKGHSLSFSTTDVLRCEVWLYYLPPTANPANLRLGVAPFIDGYLVGESSDHRTMVPGALFQVRYGAPIWVY